MPRTKASKYDNIKKFAVKKNVQPAIDLINKIEQAEKAHEQKMFMMQNQLLNMMEKYELYDKAGNEAVVSYLRKVLP